MENDPRYAAIIKAVAGQARMPYEGTGTSMPYDQYYPYSAGGGNTLGWQGLWNKLAYSPYFQPPADQPIKGVPINQRTGGPDLFAAEHNWMDRMIDQWLGPKSSQK